MPEIKSKSEVISQRVVNPVSVADSMEACAKYDLGTSGEVTLSQNVVNPVGNEGNTGRGLQAPLPMRPIPS